MNAVFKDFCHEFMVAMRQAPRVYFAPFVGAYRGIRAEYADIERDRIKESEQSQKLTSRH